MLNNLIKEFEKDKNSRCSICGEEANRNCIEIIGTLSCDTALCNSEVCYYVHNLVKHPQKHALLKRSESNINYNIRLKALSKEFRRLTELLNEYKINLDKYENIEPVSKMFKDLIEGKNEEINRIKYKIKEIEKEHKIAKSL